MTQQRSIARRRFGAVVLAAAAALAGGVMPAAAQSDYPNRPIRVVLPFAAGAVSDISLRVLGEKLGARLGVQIIVDNQPGGGGLPAARAVSTAAPDGYTLALLSNATAVSVSMFKSFTLDPRKDFVPIVGISDFPYLFVTNTASPHRTLQDFVAATRKTPGKLNVGTSSAGTSNHLTALLFKSALGLDFAVVPYRGPSELSIALLRNDLDLVVNAYGGLRQGIEQKQIRVLATSAMTRSPQFPDVPTVQEAGVPGFEVSSWNGLYGPAGTPQGVVDKLSREITAILNDPEMQKRYTDLGLEVRASPAQELDRRMGVEIARWAKVIAEAGLANQ
jgi:tripartite-type tricarboxylate transporter receptor subunit TctC